MRWVPGGHRGAGAASGQQGAGSPRAVATDAPPLSFPLHGDLRLRAASPGMAAWGPGSAVPLLRRSHGLPLLHCVQRMFASQTEGEIKVTQILKEKFPRATAIQVTDISGGCGAMYEIKIESEEFKQKRTVEQHQMVNQALKEEIKEMHGLRIFTSVPKC
ncbi:bolA 3 [Sigmodon hispidus]